MKKQMASWVWCGVVVLFLPGVLAGAAELVPDQSVNQVVEGADQNWYEGKEARAVQAQAAPALESIQRLQQEEYARYPFTEEREYDALREPAPAPRRLLGAAKGPLQRRVVGWHPYWMGTAYQRYDYSALSTIAYFSYEVNPTNGSYYSLRSWNTTPLIAWAHSNSVKVVLTATCFGNSSCRLLLTNATARQNLINNLVSVVSNYHGDGVNIDFESISDSTLRNTVTEFMSNLTVRFHRDIPGSEVSLALPAVDWSSIFDVGAYDKFMDYAIIMGYDYYYRGSTTAGPVAPLKASSTWGAYCIEKSISNYLGKGISPSKLLLGCPYYGYDWPTTDYSVPSSTRGSGSAVLYGSAVNNAAAYGRHWNSAGSCPYYFYTNSGARQCWYEDAESLGLKYDMVISKNIGGIGIWALGYDDTRTELWQLIADKFTAASSGWQPQEAGTSSSFYGVGNSSNRFVAVGASGLVRTSTDGDVWVAGTSGVSTLLLNVNGHSGTFVGVGDLGTVITSPDGQKWTSRTSGVTNMLRGIAWGTGTYVAVGADGSIITSPDAITWTTRSSGTANVLQGVTFGSNLFVAVGASGVVLTSPDGTAWTSRVSGITSWLLDSCFGANLFVAVGLGGAVVTSPDGITWTARSSGTSENLYRIAWGGGRYVAVGPNGKIISSTNGLAWVEEYSGTTNFLRGVTCRSGLFAACGYNGTLLTYGEGDPSISIDTLGATVPNATTSYTISGASANAVGLLAWANSLGGSGSTAAAASWSFSATGLSVGTNVITVAVTNAAGRSASAAVAIIRQPASGGGDASAATTSAAQPAGALDNIVVFTSAGHGFTASGSSWITGRGLLYGMNEDMGNLDQMNSFAEYCFKAGATVVPMRPVGYQTNEVVLDNDDAGVSFGGSWNNSASTIFYGSAGDTPYRYAYINTTGTSAWVIYRPTIPQSGFYPVYCWTRSGSDRVRQLYRVYHSGGVTDVRVNHRRVGLGWVWLGTYYFNRGTEGSVNISNYAPGMNPASDVAIADAIRFGNGMGDVDRGYGVSGFERELEAARYWVQRMVGQGMSSTLYDLSGYSDSDDNVGAPPRMAAEMNRAEDGSFWDRIYLGFHSNADGGAGTGRGAMGLYDTRGTSTRMYLQQQFGLACNNEIEADMEFGDNGIAFLDDWLDNSSDMYGSMYGEIYGTMTDEMNSTIIEVAFHNNSEDAKLLKDPAARQWMGRACYQAIVKHLSASNAVVPNVLLPDAPTNVWALNSSAGQVTVGWRAASVNAAGGDAASGFVVYRSTNGYGFGNPVAVPGASATSLTFTNLEIGATWFFTVCATNRGGESPNSKVVGVRVSPAGFAPHLVVNGFERFDRYQTPNRYFANNLVGNVAMVRPRQINSFDYVVQHGQAIAAAGRYFDSCDNGSIQRGLVNLPDYHAVYWILGEESTFNETFNTAEQTLVMNFLNPGKRFFVSGAELAYDLDYAGSATDRAFLTNYCKVAYATDDAGTYQATGKNGSIFAGLGTLAFDDGTAGMYNAEYPDTFYRRGTTATSVTALVYGGAESGTTIAGIQYSNVSRLVTFGFPFETITSETLRNDIMARIIAFFGDAAADAPVVAITNQDATVDSGVPAFTIGGTNNAAVYGTLVWTNFLTGAAGTLAAASAWTIPDIPIATGVNTIRVSGVNYLNTQSACATVRVTVVAGSSGAISVQLAPAEAVVAGAQWRVDGGAWRDSDYTQSGLAQGMHTVSYAAVSGWAAPPAATAGVTNGQTTVVSGQYTQLVAVGSVQVTLTPAEAVAAGAQWRVDGGAWRDSGETATNLAVGTHTIGFAALPGWTAPEDQAVSVADGITLSSGGHYTRQVGALTVLIEPSAAVDAGAQWTLDDGAAQAHEAVLNDLAVGIHTLRFVAVNGWTSSPPRAVEIKADELSVEQGTYTQLTGAITVTLNPAAAVTAGAQWRVDGGAWQSSGATLTGLLPGERLITFSTLVGWVTPADQWVQLGAGQTLATNGVYYQVLECAGFDNAQWTGESAPADGESVLPGETFTKTWSLKNTGNSTWTANGGYQLRYVEGESFGAPAFTNLPPGVVVPPGQTNTWALRLTAPVAEGVYRGTWMMYRDGFFGDPVWLDLHVIAPGGAP